MGGKTILGLGFLALLLVCLLCALHHYPEVKRAAAERAPATIVAAALPPFGATLAAGTLTLEGTVPDEEAKARILAAGASAFGAGHVVDRLQVAPAGQRVSWGANWLTRVLGWLPFLSRFGERGEIRLEGQSVIARGEVPTADVKAKLLADLRGIFGAEVNVQDSITVTESLLSATEAKAQTDLKQILLKGIEFNFGSDKVTPAGAAVLAEAVKTLAANPETRVEISGHTDNVGTDQINQTLSRRRAEAVKTFLIGKGIKGARLAAKGYGPAQPIADNATEQGRARNRRIEFRVIPAQARK